jgi:hypothetical protein
MTWKGAKAKPSLTPESRPDRYASRDDSSPPLAARKARLGRRAAAWRGVRCGGSRVCRRPTRSMLNGMHLPAEREQGCCTLASAPKAQQACRSTPAATHRLNSSVLIAAAARGIKPRISGSPPAQQGQGCDAGRQGRGTLVRVKASKGGRGDSAA